MVPQCETIILTQKVSLYIYHHISIVKADSLGRENGSTMLNHNPDPESQCGTIALPQFDSTFRFYTDVFSFADFLPYGIFDNPAHRAVPE